MKFATILIEKEVTRQAGKFLLHNNLRDGRCKALSQVWDKLFARMAHYQQMSVNWDVSYFILHLHNGGG